MEPSLRDLQQEEDLLVALSKAPQSSNPGFQSFLKSKFSEINAKKKVLSSSPSSPDSVLSAISVVTRGPKMRYQPHFDSDETSATASIHNTSNASFSASVELFEEASPFHIQGLVGKSRAKRLEESWSQEDISRGSPKPKLPIHKSRVLAGDTGRIGGNSTPSEQKLRELYEAEKARADAEHRKAQETILAMKARLLQEKERHLNDMMQVIKAHYGLSGTAPDQRQAPSVFPAPEEKRSVGTGDLGRKSKALAVIIHPEMTALPAHKSDPEDLEGGYTRMISNDSEALRDEYEQNFESVLDSTDLDNFEKRPSSL